MRRRLVLVSALAVARCTDCAADEAAQEGSCRQCAALAARAREWIAQMAADLDEADRVVARLRADNARLLVMLNRRGSGSVRALRAENARLRAALVEALAVNAMNNAAR
jgi:hypothetical protein